MKNRQMIIKLLILIFVCMFTVSCGLMGMKKDIKSWADMTTKEKASFLMSTYNKQFDSYMQLYNKADRTAADNEYLRSKKKAMEEVYPYIDQYAEYAETGTIASALVEQAALEAVNKLINM